MDGGKHQFSARPLVDGLAQCELGHYQSASHSHFGWRTHCLFFLGNDEGVSISNDSCKTFNNLIKIENEEYKLLDMAKLSDGNILLFFNYGLFKYQFGERQWQNE